MTEKAASEFVWNGDDWETITILGWPVIPGEMPESTGVTEFKFASAVYIWQDARDIRAQIFAKRCMDDD